MNNLPRRKNRETKTRAILSKKQTVLKNNIANALFWWFLCFSAENYRVAEGKIKKQSEFKSGTCTMAYYNAIHKCILQWVWTQKDNPIFEMLLKIPTFNLTLSPYHRQCLLGKYPGLTKSLATHFLLKLLQLPRLLGLFSGLQLPTSRLDLKVQNITLIFPSWHLQKRST